MEPLVMNNYPIQRLPPQQQQLHLNPQQQQSHDPRNYHGLSLMQLQPLHCESSIHRQQPECMSPASSTTSSTSTKSPSSPNKGLPDLSDEELAQLSVRQLNLKLQGHDRKIVSALKQKRRTLKNRGYALNCRVRRLHNQLNLESENVMLREQIQHLTDAVNHLQDRLHYYEPCIQNNSLSPTFQHQQPPSGTPGQQSNYSNSSSNRAY